MYQQVIGVSKDIRATGLGAVDPVFIYFAAGPRTHLGLSLLARGDAGVPAIAKAIREETQALDSNVLVQPARSKKTSRSSNSPRAFCPSWPSPSVWPDCSSPPSESTA